ncbi:hypothetical protein [Arenibacter palladensis]|uniref:hypothetical protein n=1 Tax=Arenibacter palladensis TaxID=237373 RepID=UPI0026E40CA9|nr:hypothetical protein [Arenibacter palladensis]MDO6603201.1 hypothetical protein [Arenibacter palladensis]
MKKILYTRQLYHRCAGKTGTTGPDTNQHPNNGEVLLELKIPYCLFAFQDKRLKAEGTITATIKYHGVFGRS